MAAGKEEGDLGEFRSKLVCFLEVSTSYEPGRLISDFPFDGEDWMDWIQPFLCFPLAGCTCSGRMQS